VLVEELSAVVNWPRVMLKTTVEGPYARLLVVDE
jgi:hypothetical protein